jgi:hypothetical protein
LSVGENSDAFFISFFKYKLDEVSETPGRIFRRFSFVWVENPAHQLFGNVPNCHLQPKTKKLNLDFTEFSRDKNRETIKKSDKMLLFYF